MNYASRVAVGLCVMYTQPFAFGLKPGGFCLFLLEAVGPVKVVMDIYVRGVCALRRGWRAGGFEY